MNNLTHGNLSFFRVNFLFHNCLVLFFFARQEAISPFTVVVFLKKFGYRCQCFLAIAQYGYGSLHVLVDLRGVNIEMNNLGLFGVCFEVTGYPVIKTHADSNQYITFIGL
jgi:hypothetical protein